MATWVIALIVLSALVLSCLALFVIFKIFNGPDGERYQKLRMQGPFVPLSEAGVQAGSERRRVASDPGRGDG